MQEMVKAGRILPIFGKQERGQVVGVIEGEVIRVREVAGGARRLAVVQDEGGSTFLTEVFVPARLIEDGVEVPVVDAPFRGKVRAEVRFGTLQATLLAVE